MHSKYAAALASLAVDDEVTDSEKQPPVLYTLKRNWKESQVIPQMFPDWSNGFEKMGISMDWLSFIVILFLVSLR